MNASKLTNVFFLIPKTELKRRNRTSCLLWKIEGISQRSKLQLRNDLFQLFIQQMQEVVKQNDLSFFGKQTLAVRIILTVPVPGKQRISHCVPSSPLRFREGAKTTTQLGRWRVSICRASLGRINSCSEHQRSERKLSPVTHKLTAMTHQNFNHFKRNLNHQPGNNTNSTRTSTVYWGHWWWMYCDVSIEAELLEHMRLSLVVCCWMLCCAGKSSNQIKASAVDRVYRA